MEEQNQAQNVQQDSGRKKPFYKRWWVWVLGIVLLFVLIGAAGSEPQSQSVSRDDDSNAQEQEDQQQVYEIGEDVQLGESIVTVNDVEFSSGGQFSQPSSGNQYLNLNVTIENTSDSQQYITTMGQMFVRDGEGNSYQVAVTGKTIENPNNSLDGQIIANSKRTGWVGFEVPQEASDLVFQYNGSMWGGGDIKVNLGR